MSCALIDNSSLTAVQRLLGRIEVRGDHSVEGDIAAFEQLIHAILFYHEVVSIDDYKPEHRLSRATDFPFVRFVNPRELGLEKIELAAADEAKKFMPAIRGGGLGEDGRS